METLVTKFELPAPPAHALGRRRVLDLLPVVPGAVTAIVAPAGFGKSSILAAWVDSIAMPTGSIRLDESDQDVSRFGRHLAAAAANALGAVLPKNVSAALSAARTVDAATRLTPFLNLVASDFDLHLVLDDYHHASSPDTDEVMRFVIENAPANLRLSMASRVRPDLGFMRLRAAGRLTELTPVDLALDVAEVAELLSQILGAPVSADEASAVRSVTEGWPVLVALVAHSAASGDRAIADILDGTAHELGEYVLEEVVGGLDAATRDFVQVTSILDEISGPLADAVTGTSGSGAKLELVRRSGFPIDQSTGAHGWYRYHQHVAETLRNQLANTVTTLEIQEFHRRAAAWFADEGMSGEAVRHAVAGGSQELAAEIVATEWLARVNNGELATVRRWLTHLPAQVVEEHVALLLAMAWSNLMVGEVHNVSSYLTLAREQDPTDVELPGASSQESGILLIEALYYRMIGRLSEACAAGDAALALEVEPGTAGRARALTYSGICRFWNGQFDEAARLLNHGAGIGERFDHRMARLLALGYLGLIESERQSVDELGTIVAEAERVIVEGGLQLHPASAPALTASGLHQAAIGNESEALAKLDGALGVAAIQSEPGLLAYLNLACARLLDSGGHAEIAERRRKVADALCRQAEDVGFVAARTRSLSGRQTGSGLALTARETSVLLLLGSSLSMPEIAAELFVSRNTVKTHVQSLYRKLGVSRREDAVGAAAALGLS